MNDSAALPPGIPSAAPPAPDTRPLFFLHIPKTAGTSFLLALRNAFGDDHVLRLDGAEEVMRADLRAVVEGQRKGTACVAGHVPLHLVAECCDGDIEQHFRPFAILRHPIARVFSLFRFLRRAPEAELARLGLAPGFDFPAFIDSRHPELFAQVNNGMTRLLCNDTALHDPRRLEFWQEQCPPATVQSAVDTLSAMPFGLAEHMEDTERLLRQGWNLRTKLDIGNENTTGQLGVEEDVATIGAIVARNQADLTLYDRAAALFHTRARATGANKAAAGGALFVPAIDRAVAVTDIPGRQGFHAADEHGFCWLRADHPARIHLRATQPRATVKLQGYAITRDYPIARMTLTLNGRRVIFQSRWTEPYWFELETELLEFDRQHCTIEIDPPYFLSVRQLRLETQDQRYLSVGLRTFTLRAEQAASAAAWGVARPAVR